MSSAALTIRTSIDDKKAIANFAHSLGLSTSSFITAVTLQAVREQRVVLTPTVESLEPTPYLETIMRTTKADREADRNFTTIRTAAELDDLFKTL